jgi:hypothetical protein
MSAAAIFVPGAASRCDRFLPVQPEIHAEIQRRERLRRAAVRAGLESIPQEEPTADQERVRRQWAHKFAVTAGGAS